MSEKVQRHPGKGGLIVGVENVPPQAPPTLCPGAIVGHVPSRRFLLCVCVCVCVYLWRRVNLAWTMEFLKVGE